jgi:hypothetical protein
MRQIVSVSWDCKSCMSSLFPHFRHGLLSTFRNFRPANNVSQCTSFFDNTSVCWYVNFRLPAACSTGCFVQPSSPALGANSLVTKQLQLLANEGLAVLLITNLHNSTSSTFLLLVLVCKRHYGGDPRAQHIHVSHDSSSREILHTKPQRLQQSVIAE